jgi:hypothetical protein
MIKFFNGLWNTPGAKAVRQEIQTDKVFRWFLIISLISFAIEVILL